MRYMLAKKGSKKVSSNIHTFLKEEDNLKMNSINRFDIFKEQCEKSKKDLFDYCKIKSQIRE